MKNKKHSIFSYPNRIKIIEFLMKGDGVPTTDVYSYLGISCTRASEELSALETIGVIDRAKVYDTGIRRPDIIFLNTAVYELAKREFIGSLP